MEWDGATLAISAAGCGALHLQPRVLGQGDWSVEFAESQHGGWTPSVTSASGGMFEGLVMEGQWSLEGESDAVLWRQGYQSWSWSGVTLPGDAVLDDDGVVAAGGDDDGTSVAFENDSSSWWVGLLGRDDGGSLLLGSQGALYTRFFVGIDGDDVQAVWGHSGSEIAVAANEAPTLDPLWVQLGSDALAMHEAYADAVADLVPPPNLDARAPTGWATWYQYYSEVTEEDVRTNLDALVDLQTDDSLASVEVFQIDDGWQVRWGDWWAGDDFPSGMESLATDIAAAGMTPGVWMAPFYMSTDSDTYAAHADWWVLDEAGDPIEFTNLGTGNYVILDVTHPDAADWLYDVIEGMVAQGYDYLKLDFLYAGAMEGTRQEDVTGIAAFHIGMEIMREAAGDAWILACGAPLLPSLGYANSFRTGADIAFEVSPDPAIDYYRWQARSTAARSWTHGRWWWMDPDQLIVRDPLTDAEIRGAVASLIVAGGTWMLGDDLTTLEDERLALSLDPQLTALLGQAVTPIDPLLWVSKIDPSPVIEEVLDDDEVPVEWELDDGTVVLLNLGLESVDTQGPGGLNLLTGETASAGIRTLEPGDGEVWQP